MLVCNNTFCLPDLPSLLHLVTMDQWTLLAHGAVMAGLILLCFLEIKVKIEARALQILLNKDTRSVRKVQLINFTQTVVLVSLVHLRQSTTEQQVLALYMLAAKSVQTGRRQLRTDWPGLLATWTFAFLLKPHVHLSVLEYMDECLRELTMILIPILLSSLMILLIPLLLPLVAAFLCGTTVWLTARLLALLRRKYTEDFDFFVTLAICVLVWKILKKELLLRQGKLLSCSSLQSRALLLSSLESRAQLDPLGAWSRALLTPDFVEQWCSGPPQPSSIPSTAELQPLSISGNYEEMESLFKAQDNFRIWHVVSSRSLPPSPPWQSSFPLLSPPSPSGGAASYQHRTSCNLTLAHIPRYKGMKGILHRAIFQIYLVATWILPESVQRYVSVFGYEESWTVVECDCECQELSQLVLLDTGSF